MDMSNERSLTNRNPRREEECRATSQKQLVVVDAGALAKRNIVPQHRAVQDDMFLPPHQIPNELGQSRVFDEGSVSGIRVGIDQDLFLRRICR